MPESGWPAGEDMCPSQPIVRPVLSSTLALIDRNIQDTQVGFGLSLACVPLDILEVTAPFE